jgi:hypothetical protein
MEWCVPTAGSPGPTDGPQPTGRQAAGQVMLLTFSAHCCALSRQCRCSRCAATWHGRPNVVELFIANRRCRRHTSSTSSVSIHGSAVTDTRPRRADAGRWPDRAHRLGYGPAHGFDALLAAEVVAHRFDNPLCQLPEHWRESTHAQNRQEWAARRHQLCGPIRDLRSARGRRWRSGMPCWPAVGQGRRRQDRPSGPRPAGTVRAVAGYCYSPATWPPTGRRGAPALPRPSNRFPHGCCAAWAPLHVHVYSDGVGSSPD